jgi:hypothetical protein
VAPVAPPITADVPIDYREQYRWRRHALDPLARALLADPQRSAESDVWAIETGAYDSAAFRTLGEATRPPGVHCFAVASRVAATADVVLERRVSPARSAPLSEEADSPVRRALTRSELRAGQSMTFCSDGRKASPMLYVVAAYVWSVRQRICCPRFGHGCWIGILLNVEIKCQR